MYIWSMYYNLTFKKENVFVTSYIGKVINMNRMRAAIARNYKTTLNDVTF